jgi:hypothetical protein
MKPASLVKLKKLTTSDDEPIADIMNRVVSKLGSDATRHPRTHRWVQTPATFELRLPSNAGKTEVTTFTTEMTSTGATLLTERVPDPTLVAIMSTETFRGIVQGATSPRQALLDGSLKLQGNVQLARDIIRPLAGSGPAVGACPPYLVFDSYSPVADGGTLTLSGRFFTSGGTVSILYDYGGNSVEQEVTADVTGNFDATQAGLPCGEIVGQPPGIGVVVTATDLSSGDSAASPFPTRC